MAPLAEHGDLTRLSLSRLDGMPSGTLRPHYARDALRPGIVHIGLGNFHRAHQSWYSHRLMQQGLALDWAIIGAGVRPADAVMREKLLAQDCLTTLIELDPGTETVEIVGPMIDFLPIEDGHGPLIRQMADPAIRIVSLTVTEGGYYLDAEGHLDIGHADLQWDIAHPDRPRSAFGAILAALGLRRAAGVGPFTALSCDNLQNNGDLLRRVVVGLARQIDPDLAAWIDTQGAFPNSMVDCIVPATSDALRQHAAALGIHDAAPVSHENFRQWVIEDAFCAGRPPWEEVGATLTDDVHSYEMMKLRLLNGGHQLLANAGELLSLATIADCIAHPGVRRFFQQVEAQEIAPHVAPVPGMTPHAYLDLIVRRFENPAIEDSTRRVAFDGSSRHPGFLLPSLREGLASGAPISGLALAEALWARMCAGSREDGSAIEPNDPNWDRLQATAQQARLTPRAWLSQDTIYGDHGADPVFVDAFESWLSALWQDGTAACLARYTGG